MSYTLNGLKTKAECDRVLERAQFEKESLEVQTVRESHEVKGTNGKVPDVVFRITDLQGRIDGITARLLTMPEGNKKLDLADEQFALMTQQRHLYRWQRNRFGEEGVFDQVDRAGLDLLIDNWDTFMLEVETHKATLAE